MKYLKRFNEGIAFGDNSLESMEKPEIIEELYDISQDLYDDGFDVYIEEYYWQPKQYIIYRILPGDTKPLHNYHTPHKQTLFTKSKDVVNENVIETVMRVIDCMYQKSYDLGASNWGNCEDRLRVKRKSTNSYYVITKEELNEFIGVDFEIIELVFVPII